MGFASASLALVLCASMGAAQGGAASGQTPPSRAEAVALLPLERVATIDMPPLSVEALLEEDLERQAQGLPPRFALPQMRRITPRDGGTWEDLDAERLLWRLRIRAAGAPSLNLGFGEYHMTAGGSLYLYSADLHHLVRPFTARDNEEHGELWTPMVLTDELVIEVVVPRAELELFVLELTWINVGYRRLPVGAYALSSGSCNVDVACPEGLPWALEIPSVGLISIDGSAFCSGFLVNNLRQDLKPYFMTANHCGITAGSAASLVVYWNYENSACRPPGSPSSGGQGDGSLAQFNTGAILRAARGVSDFTLVELDDAVEPTFDASYAGWNASGTTGTSGVTIHHPNLGEKRISFEDSPPRTTSYLSNPSPGDGSHVRVIDWDLGTTEPGSSGSPLFDPQHRVIGQLHGGTASCSSQTSDWYGKFAVSWAGGSTSSTRLRDWLDPDDTGVLFSNSVSLATLCSDAGTLTLERVRYACADTAEVSVFDCGLDTNDAVAETASVLVTSSSEPAGESVLLTESGPATGLFRGALALAETDQAGVLLVTAGDALSASYVDADDGHGGLDVLVSDSAVVDCTPPAVLSVSFSNLTAVSARLTVVADEPILVEAFYGTSCAQVSHYLASAALSGSAVVELTDLLPDTTYHLELLASDEAGNTLLDDNSGACYAFTTASAPRFFTEEFLGDNDLDHRALILRPAAGSDGYAVCERAAVTAFSTDPSGGTPLALTDDNHVLVSLDGGRTVLLYGTAYSSFYVNANGNLTFGSFDDSNLESLGVHFAKPRISALFDDLKPMAGGTVSSKQLADRIALTWQDVPEFGFANHNSFQIELFFDGAIRLTYLELDATDGIVGLSRGTGLSAQFVEMDLSEVGCEFTPDARRSGAPTGAVTTGF